MQRCSIPRLILFGNKLVYGLDLKMDLELTTVRMGARDHIPYDYSIMSASHQHTQTPLLTFVDNKYTPLLYASPSDLSSSQSYPSSEQASSHPPMPAAAVAYPFHS